MHPLIEQHRAEIALLCRRYAVRRLEVFGSAARCIDVDPARSDADFPARSDADFLVDFESDTGLPPLEQYFGLAEELEQLLGRKVDLLERPAVEASRNYIRRREILAGAEPVFG